MVGGFGGRHRASLGGAPERHDQREEQAEKQQRAEGQRLAQRDGGRAEAGDRLGEDGGEFVHDASIADSGGAMLDQNENKNGRKAVDA